MTPRVFLACSSEKLPLAAAVIRNLHGHARVRPWTRGIFKLSRFTLESLEAALSEFDAGIFLLAPDDIASIRRKKSRVVRDNVLFELGLFVGALGRTRTFLVRPRAIRDLHLPTDLTGITAATYNIPKGTPDWLTVLQPACDEIRTALREMQSGRTRSRDLRVERLDFFNEFHDAFASLFSKARSVTTFFIHSRRWREDHMHSIRAFLARKGRRLTVILPEPGDRDLETIFRRNFQDGPYIPGFIQEACAFYLQLRKEFPGAVRLRFVRNYPTYSFYRFDDTVLAAMYPTTNRKKQVPAFLVSVHSEIGGFIKDDEYRLLRASRPPRHDEVRRFLRSNNKL